VVIRETTHQEQGEVVALDDEVAWHVVGDVETAGPRDVDTRTGPKIKNCLFPLYLPTQQNAPTRHILFANFKSKYYYFHFAPKKSKFCVIFYYIYIQIVLNKIKKIFYLPTDSIHS
jgi:hypothetical protein